MEQEERLAEYRLFQYEISKIITENSSSFKRARKEKSKYMYPSNDPDLFEKAFYIGAASVRDDIESIFKKYLKDPDLLLKKSERFKD